MEISIITVNLNNKIGLQRTVNSVLSQTTPPFDWIIIDGGSTDGSKELVEDNAKHFSYWCSELDKGIYNAMNKGIAHAHGDYCLFLNSGDELYDSEVLEKAKTFVNAIDDKCFVYGDCVLYDKETLFKGAKFFPNKISLLDLYTNSLCHQALFVPTSYMKNTKYDETYRIGSDYKLILQAWHDDVPFVHYNGFVCRFNDEGISNTLKELSRKEHERITEEMFGSDIRNILFRYQQLLGEYYSIKQWSERAIPRTLRTIMEYFQLLIDGLNRWGRL